MSGDRSSFWTSRARSRKPSKSGAKAWKNSAMSRSSSSPTMRSKKPSTLRPRMPRREVTLSLPSASNHGLSAIRRAPLSRKLTMRSGAPRKSRAWRVGGVSRMILE